MNQNLTKLFRCVSFKSSYGVTLVELLMTLALISIGILPILSALSDMTEAALTQRDKITGMTIGNLVMDSYLYRFQLLDALHPQGFTTYGSKKSIYPPVSESNINLLSPEGKPFRDIFMNGANYRTVAEFILMDGSNGTQDLSNSEKLIYRIDLTVWRILHPILSDDLKSRRNGLLEEPSFKKGDEIVYQLSSLYSQTNSQNPIFK